MRLLLTNDDGIFAPGINALARELSKYNISVTVVDKNDDVGGDASKSNSGLFSTSATMPVGTLECQLRTIAHSMIMNVCKELDVPVIECGSIAPVLYPDQLETAKNLAKKEGIMCGISSGTNVAAAIKLAKKLGRGKTVVTVLPDTAERYFSTPLFE